MGREGEIDRLIHKEKEGKRERECEYQIFIKWLNQKKFIDLFMKPKTDS